MSTKPYAWDKGKDRLLRAERGISFEDIVEALAAGPFEVRANPSRNHPYQRVFAVWIEGYPWVVPFQETADTIFLKTAFPDRRLKK